MYEVTMIDVNASPEDGIWPGRLYLPGCPVPSTERGPECIMCQGLIDYAGSAHPTTGLCVAQEPWRGQHDGIVSFLYAPAEGAPIMEQDYSHLRCIVESGLRMEVGPPVAVPVSFYKPRHLRIA